MRIVYNYFIRRIRVIKWVLSIENSAAQNNILLYVRIGYFHNLPISTIYINTYIRDIHLQAPHFVYLDYEILYQIYILLY